MVDDSNRPSLQDQTPDLSVIVLCYHAGEPIKLLVQRLIDALVGSGVPTFELVLVANDWPGSTDQTAKIVSALAIADTRLVPVIERKEGMMGWDVRQGLRRAHGNVLAIFEGDGQVAPVELIRAYNLLRRGSYDIVKTYRAARHDGFKRRCLSFVYNGLFHLLFPRVRARDINSKPKLLTRAAYEQLRLSADDWFIDAEIMLQAQSLNLRIGELPTTFQSLEGRQSFVTAGTVVEFIGNLIRYRFKTFRRSRRR
ncbi:MAG: hypothetical protein A3J59_03620 [Candidatus Buchananbacteria bacterium RIFCSPHIGHO2_02_FULL_56_16]|uniref:Glycosyltransferase 2-like domain-containing protein n=1 Tax=Candidatus Buchananbacteria bacterium RIFCSPHIGHO2_02_FULL_56_16 TaxID=1797542 RepID=A0A1G1YJ52_9BACT|nr:MAG: hypothetical protein A3J59_03620 [Candidatus Buchananbacteria bacterium RIFCSPHIGHO2_02_FULL_56_16]